MFDLAALHTSGLIHFTALLGKRFLLRPPFVYEPHQA